MSKNINKKVLIIAYACEPNRTSEPGVGWNFSLEISKYIDTTVITRDHKISIINENISPKDKRKFIYYNLPKIVLKFKKYLPFGAQIHFFLWQIFSYFHIRKLIKDKKLDIDIIHQLNFATSWINPPSFLLKKKYIWGPVGGGDLIPFNFMKKLKFSAFFREFAYFSLNKISRISPFNFLLRKNISAIIFRTKSLEKNYIKLNPHIIRATISETANMDIPSNYRIKVNKYINAICVGRMTYWKNFLIAVKAFHMFLENGGEGKLNLCGNGPELNSIKQYVNKFNLQDNIIIHGFLKNKKVKEMMLNSNLLIHPSFREGGSWSIMEAMNYGLPVICLNTSGPKDMVSDKCGILLNFNSEDELIKDMSNALYKLKNNLDLFNELSNNAINRIHHEYTWEKRAKQIYEIYKKVLDEKD